MIATLLSYLRHATMRFFARHRLAKIATVSGFALALVFAMALMYALFSVGFMRIASDSYFAEVLVLYVVELFLLISGVLVFASALISGLFALFGGSGDPLVVSSPRFRWKLILMTTRVSLASTWPLAVVIVPALLALVRQFELSFAGFIIAFVASSAFVVSSALFALALLLAIGTLLERFNMFSRGNVAMCAGGLFALGVAYIWLEFRAVDLVTFFQARLVAKSLPDISPVFEQFSAYPSHLAALSTLASLREAYLPALAATGGLILLSIFALYSVSFFDGKRYLVLWQRAREGTGDMRLLGKFGSGMLRAATSAHGAIFAKETIAFVRNMRGMLWLLFIILIWAIQSASSKIATRGLGSERVADGDVSLWLPMLEFGIILYFVAMFALRYAFPSFSAERRSAWLMGSAPLDLRSIFRAKLVFFAGLFTLIALLFAFFSVFAIGLSSFSGTLLLALVLIGAVTITLSALAIGAIFPNPDTDDPEYLSTTLPGLGFILLSLLYGAFGAYAFGGLLRADGTLLLAVFVLISFVVSVFLWRKAEQVIVLRGYEY
jgi:hypothetical protein